MAYVAIQNRIHVAKVIWSPHHKDNAVMDGRNGFRLLLRCNDVQQYRFPSHWQEEHIAVPADTRYEQVCCPQTSFWTYGVRHSDSAGHVITNAMLDHCNKCKVALMNGGGIRDSIGNAGDETSFTISFGDIDKSIPYDNALIESKVTGSVLLSAIKHSVENYNPGRGLGKYLHFAGLRVAWNPEVGVPLFVDLCSLWNSSIGECAPGAWNKLNEEDEVYYVSVDFIIEGGDKYDMLKKDEEGVFEVGPRGERLDVVVEHYLQNRWVNMNTSYTLRTRENCAEHLGDDPVQAFNAGCRSVKVTTTTLSPTAAPTPTPTAAPTKSFDGLHIGLIIGVPIILIILGLAYCRTCRNKVHAKCENLSSCDKVVPGEGENHINDVLQKPHLAKEKAADSTQPMLQPKTPNRNAKKFAREEEFPQVIISYATDSRGGKGKEDMWDIAKLLKENGITSFNGEQIKPGETWQKWYGRLDTAKVAIILLSPEYFKSGHCVEECVAILTSNTKCIPVQYGMPNMKGNFLGEENDKILTAGMIRTMLGNVHPPPDQGGFHDDFQTHAKHLIDLLVDENQKQKTLVTSS